MSKASDLAVGIGNPKLLLSPGVHGGTATGLPLRGSASQTHGVVGLNEHDPGGQRLLEGTLRAREVGRRFGLVVAGRDNVQPRVNSRLNGMKEGSGGR